MLVHRRTFTGGAPRRRQALLRTIERAAFDRLESAAGVGPGAGFFEAVFDRGGAALSAAITVAGDREYSRVLFGLI